MALDKEFVSSKLVFLLRVTEIEIQPTSSDRAGCYTEI